MVVNFDLIANAAVYLMPIVVIMVLWESWLHYIRVHHIHKIDWVLLEIKLPRELLKSPAAMEMVLSSMHQHGDPNFVDAYWKGKLRPWFTLEIASLGGVIHFYIRAQRKFKNLIEAQVYSQYPGVEIYTVDDYTANVPYGLPGSDWNMFGVEFKFEKADPYPIKTYVDYGLDKEPGEATFQADPITPIIEILGNIGPNEQFWIQYLIMVSKSRFPKPGAWFAKQGWKEQGQDLVNSIMKRDAKTKSSKQLSSAGFPILPSLSEGERKTIEAIERNISKLGFDVGIRMIYLGKGKDYDKKQGSNSIYGATKQFNSHELNAFKPGIRTDFDLPWDDIMDWRLKRRKRIMFDSYRRRDYFYYPYPRKPMVLNVEELATMYHFPSQLAQTPGLSRIESKRAEPPSNLPI